MFSYNKFASNDKFLRSRPLVKKLYGKILPCQEKCENLYTYIKSAKL